MKRSTGTRRASCQPPRTGGSSAEPPGSPQPRSCPAAPCSCCPRAQPARASGADAAAGLTQGMRIQMDARTRLWVAEAYQGLAQRCGNSLGARYVPDPFTHRILVLAFYLLNTIIYVRKNKAASPSFLVFPEERMFKMGRKYKKADVGKSRDPASPPGPSQRKAFWLPSLHSQVRYHHKQHRRDCQHAF